MTIKTSGRTGKAGSDPPETSGSGASQPDLCKIPGRAFCQTDRILSPRQTENYPADRQDSFPETDRKLSGNKKERDKNDLSKRESQEDRSPYGNFQNVFLSAKELENVRQTVPNWQDYIERLSRLHGFHRKAVPEPCSQPSSAGRCRTIPLPGKNSMKVRSTKHYEKVHRKTDRSPSSQRVAAG